MYNNQIEKIVADDVPAVFLVYPWVPEIKAMGKKVQGLSHIPDGLIRAKTIWLRQ